MDPDQEIYLRNFVKGLQRQIAYGQSVSLLPLFGRYRDPSSVREEGFYLSTDEIHQLQRVRQLQGLHLKTLKRMGEIIETRDRNTHGHTDRMSDLAVRLSAGLGWKVERQESLEIGTYLHDIGKVGVPAEILNRTGHLTKREFKHILKHPQLGAALLRSVDFLHPIVPYVLYHQERYDGQGYPFGLSGKKIPVEGRVMAALDTFDALTHARPYRECMGLEEAIKALQKEAGQQLDPEIVEVFVGVLTVVPASCLT